MNIYRILCTLSLGALLFTACSSPENESAAAESDSTAMTSTEEGGWITLFDGSSLDQWRNYKSDSANWSIEGDALTSPGGQGDLITKEQFGDFELEFDWRIAEGSNSGVIYLSQEGDQYNSTYETGPEYQLIDDENYGTVHNMELEKSQLSGANYALDEPQNSQLKPIGEYNQGKIIVNDGHVEHWLNGQKVVEYELWTDEWNNKVAETKFKDMPDYAKSKEGHIALQDHGDPVWFKNVRIRPL
uniref:DUF1080 domain-containing protein n=1 Tax=Roseihalotalea indica TaxID=2867963 RepID=A0AA49GIW8_9BACT|nr:DUF1080 domain-containing protein [Tunicatimonas sp. TK19036]